MAIKYFPNRVFKKNPSPIDRLISKRNPRTVAGFSNVSSTGIDAYISSDTDWQIDSIKFNFSNTVARDYSVWIASGLKVVKDMNDWIWFQTPTTLWQKIVLTPGFYTGTTLATELQTRLNANAAYTAQGLTFTVVYVAETGLFTITPSSGTIKYIQTNNTQRLPERDSTGGHLVGLTTDTIFAANVVSDITQFGLNNEAWVIDESGSIVTEHYNDDVHRLSMDQALHFKSNTAAVNITYEVVYKEID